MTLDDSFPAFQNSPATTITGDISATATTIAIAECGVLPPAPNIATIQHASLDPDDDDAETIHYGAKSATSGAGNLSDVTRAYDATGTYGGATAWATGDRISRNVCAVDVDTANANILYHAHKEGECEGGVCTVGVTAPSSPETGVIWYDTS